MQTGKSLIERGTKRPHSAAASDLPARHTRLFASSSVKVKKKPEEFISGLPTGLLEDVIFSFLGLERVKLFQLNKTLKERFDGNSSIKPALVKELLLTLVKAFQIPNPEYSLDQAILLLNGTLKLTKLNPMEYHLAQVMFGTRPSGTVQIKKDILMQAFQDPRNLALAKTILLALIHANQHLKAAYLGCLFFELSKSEQDVPEDWLDFPFALMVSGKQEAAENWIRTYPHFVKLKGRVVDRDGAIYKGITLYQYTLCLKHTQMRLMLRQYLSLEEAALQASEYESGQNRDMQALKLKYEELMKKTYQAYQYYLDHCNSWTDLQEKDYWIRVIGRLQREWPVHWMQELCREGFNGETEFSSHHALPVAKYYNIDNEIDELVELYPLRQGYLNAKLELRRGSGYELLGKRLISHDFL
ncbi:MAG TPA: hypothetical protein VLH77_05955, partial [Gammaproteobacteria bacterium]|nr:hypothetical protein [Gammaproteobacteria bacterium]